MSSTAEAIQHNHDLSDADLDLVHGAQRALDAGVELKRWWEAVESGSGGQGIYKGKYKEARVYNRPEDHSFGFAEVAHLKDGDMKVIGNVQQQLYYRPKGEVDPHFIQQQIRAFVLRYFMRTSAYQTPQPEPEEPQLSKPLAYLSQIPGPCDFKLQGFGYSQRYYKRRGARAIGKFAPSEQSAIIDMETLQKEYDWILVRNPIVNFQMNIRPLGVRGPDLTLPIPDSVNWVVLSPATITIDENPGNGLLARYGIGYAFMRTPGIPGFFDYGPGQLEPTVQLLVWEVRDRGDVIVKMTFVSQAPTGLFNISPNPLAWPFAVINLLTANEFASYLKPFSDAVNMVPFSTSYLDPVLPMVRLLNLFTGNLAGDQLGISEAQINKTLTYIHFEQHYNAVMGSRQTWEQFSDWTDETRLPHWVKNGHSTNPSCD
jgi:hypothetical protein